MFLLFFVDKHRDIRYRCDQSSQDELAALMHCSSTNRSNVCLWFSLKDHSVGWLFFYMALAAEYKNPKKAKAQAVSKSPL